MAAPITVGMFVGMGLVGVLFCVFQLFRVARAMTVVLLAGQAHGVAVRAVVGTVVEADRAGHIEVL